VSVPHAGAAFSVCLLVLSIATEVRAQDASEPGVPSQSEEVGEVESADPEPSTSSSDDAAPAGSSDASEGPFSVPDSAEIRAVPPPVPRTKPLEVEPAPPVPAPKSFPLRLPAFIALGIGGLSAGGAAVLATVAPRNDPRLNCTGTCAEGARRLALTAVLASTAAVGLGVGVALLVVSPKTKEPSLSPQVGVGLNLRKASATALWRF
jgi:hypothetical protein